MTTRHAALRSRSPPSCRARHARERQLSLSRAALALLWRHGYVALSAQYYHRGGFYLHLGAIAIRRSFGPCTATARRGEGVIDRAMAVESVLLSVGRPWGLALNLVSPHTYQQHQWFVTTRHALNKQADHQSSLRTPATAYRSS
jgi:hypothetical protein